MSAPELPEPAQRPLWEQQLASIERDCKQRNWDSYHADPIDQRAIDAARRLCESLMVFPTKNGGVTVNLAGEDVQIELTDDGQLEDFYLSVTDVGRFLRPPSSDTEQASMSLGVSDFSSREPELALVDKVEWERLRAMDAENEMLKRTLRKIAGLDGPRTGAAAMAYDAAVLGVGPHQFEDRDDAEGRPSDVCAICVRYRDGHQ